MVFVTFDPNGGWYPRFLIFYSGSPELMFFKIFQWPFWCRQLMLKMRVWFNVAFMVFICQLHFGMWHLQCTISKWTIPVFSETVSTQKRWIFNWIYGTTFCFHGISHPFPPWPSISRTLSHGIFSSTVVVFSWGKFPGSIAEWFDTEADHSVTWRSSLGSTCFSTYLVTFVMDWVTGTICLDGNHPWKVSKLIKDYTPKV